MQKVKIPSFLSFNKKYGLLVSDTDVLLVSWKKGNLERIAHFSNDDEGIAQFSSLLAKNEKEYKNCAFHILTNIIGEDYRLEKVAHLLGQYKTQFHSRRMNQLFRGSTLCLSMVQGREERGRREDFVLFYGLLTEGKVSPWMTTVTRSGGRYLAGVNSIALSSHPVLNTVTSKGNKGNHLLMTIHEKSLLRQTHFVNGKIRFSRVSKIKDDNTEEVAISIKKELERTFQYLNLLKVSVAEGIDVQFVCPGNIVGQLRELLTGSQRVRFNFYDASTVAEKIGLKSYIAESGRDSSIFMHSMFSHMWFKQLAAFSHVRYYLTRSFTNVAMVVLGIYGIYNIVPPIGTFYSGYQESVGNSQLTVERDERNKNYNANLTGDEGTVSKAENIEAVSRAFRLLKKLDASPTQLMYYFSVALQNNPKVLVNEMRWYVTSDVNKTEGDVTAFFSGNDVLQVLEVSGEFTAIPNETYRDVSNRADKLEKSFESRSDINIEYVERPQKDLGKGELSGTLDEDYSVEAARSRLFRMRLIWKAYSAEDIEKIQRSEGQV